MNQLDRQLKSKLIHVSKQYFPVNTNNNVIKINHEPYSYCISITKMYVFDQNDLVNFLIWYWNNYRESFLFDVYHISHKIQWKYFCDYNPGFIDLYPDTDTFRSNVFEQNDLVNIYSNLINVNGFNHFINNVVINNYKSMDIKKNYNKLYKFATDCGTQIFI